MPKPGLFARILGAGFLHAMERAGLVRHAGHDGTQPRADSGVTTSSYHRSGGAKWPGGLSQPNASHVLDHWRLRQAARDAMQDSQVARAIVERWAESVVGTGLRLAPEPNIDLLGLSPEAADAWAQDVFQRFHFWAASKEQHRAGTLTWYQSQFLYERAQHRDNDMFVRFFYSARPDLLNPLQWEMLDPNQIRGDAWTATAWLGSTDDGIDRDDQGYERGYRVWVLRMRPGGQWEPAEVTIPRWGEKSGRLFMIHGFNPEYAGQGRGFSRIAHALQEFENITDFTVAQVKKAISQSMIWAFTESEGDAPSGNPLEGLLISQGAGPAGQTFQPGTGAPAASTASVIDSAQFTAVPEATVTEPGTLMLGGLEGRNRLKPFVNTAPAETFDKFVDGLTSHLSASVGIPVEQVLMRFNANYSASRACMVLFYRNCLLWREEMAADYLNPAYEMWLTGEIAAGRVACPGFGDPVLRQAWLACRWVGLPMPNIDPSATAKADQLYVEMGAQDLDDVARNLNGSSGRANRARLTRQYQELPRAPWAASPRADAPQTDSESPQEPPARQNGQPGNNGKQRAEILKGGARE